jgi:hypothetical protein
MATRTDISYRLGEHWIIEVACKDVDGNALDLTGGDFKFRISDDGTVLVDANVGAGVEVPDPLSGIAVVTVAPADQTAIKPGTYLCEGRAVLSDATVSDQVYGSFQVLASLFD